MNDDVAFVDAEDLGGALLSALAMLGRGPYLTAAIFELDGDVHGLQVGVCEERKLVDAFNTFGGGNCVWIEDRIGGVPVLLRVEGRA
jgi:hypothetical protein